MIAMKKVVSTIKAPEPWGPYSQAVQAGGFLFVSGQLAIDPRTGKLITANITVQTQQVMENINAILNAADYRITDIVQSTVYLADMALFEEFNREYSKYFNADYPARAAVACTLKAGALVEVAVVAFKE